MNLLVLIQVVGTLVVCMGALAVLGATKEVFNPEWYEKYQVNKEPNRLKKAIGYVISHEAVAKIQRAFTRKYYNDWEQVKNRRLDAKVLRGQAMDMRRAAAKAGK